MCKWSANLEWEPGNGGRTAWKEEQGNFLSRQKRSVACLRMATQMSPTHEGNTLSATSWCKMYKWLYILFQKFFLDCVSKNAQYYCSRHTWKKCLFFKTFLVAYLNRAAWLQQRIPLHNLTIQIYYFFFFIVSFNIFLIATLGILMTNNIP